VSVGVVSAARLQHSNRRELLRLESNSSLLGFVHGVADDIVCVPFSFFLVPDSDLDHGGVLRHEQVVRYFNSNFNRVIDHSHGSVGEGDDLQALFNREDTTHSPFELSLSNLRVGIHAEVHNSTNNDIRRLLCESQVVEAGPEATDHNLHGGVLLGEGSLADLFLLGSARVELEADSLVRHVLGADVGPDSEDQVFAVEEQLNKVFLENVALVSFSLILFSSDFSDFFSSSL